MHSNRGRFWMNLHLSYVPSFDLGFAILDFGFIKSAIRNPHSAILLDLFYINFRETLTVALLACVLLAALFLENNDLVAFAVADNDRGKR